MSLVAAVARLNGGRLEFSDNQTGLRATLVLAAMAGPARAQLPQGRCNVRWRRQPRSGETAGASATGAERKRRDGLRCLTGRAVGRFACSLQRYMAAR